MTKLSALCLAVLLSGCGRKDAPGERAQQAGASASAGAGAVPASSQPAAPSFEGCVALQHFSAALPEGTVKALETICIKGELLRSESSEAPGVVSLLDFRARQVQRGSVGGGALPSAVLADTEPSPARLTKTPEKDHVAGVECELWRVERAATYELCVASNMYGAPLLQARVGLALAEANARFFPLRTVLIENGKRQLLSQARSVTPKALPSRDFAPPR